jgi:pyruvate formate lyase activating enzyme
MQAAMSGTWGRKAALYAVMGSLGLCILAVPFLARPARAAPAAEQSSGNSSPRKASPASVDVSTLKEALYYRKLGDGEVQCRLCPRECLLREGEIGDCGVKLDSGGTLYSLVYGRPCALSVEPIEKAPFDHFLPGSTRLCIATVGCNLRCSFCQNWQISQQRVEEVEHLELSPEQVVERALQAGVQSICFTFSEPIVFYEYMLDIATLARQRGLKAEMVSNGFINPEPLRRLLEVLDGVKIDLKAFTDEFYRDITMGRLEPVLASIMTVAESGRWLEIVNLVIPTLNDDPADLGRMCTWIAKELGPDVPVHFTRFSPNYKLTDLPPTPVKTLELARDTAVAAGIHYVYVGNVPGHPSQSTVCPACGALLIEREGFTVKRNLLREGKCPYCGTTIPGVWR